MSRSLRLFLVGFLSLVILTSLATMIFSREGGSSAGPVTQREIYHSDDLRLEDIDPNN